MWRCWVRISSVVVPGVVVVSLVACSAGTTTAAGSGRLRVVASFYPLQFVAQRVGGDVVEVTSLTKPGAEPHDLELTPSDVAAVGDADAVIYLRGFQPAVDKAIEQNGDEHAFDARDTARLTLRYTPIEAGKAVTDAAGATDPHFWLDPVRLSDVADAFAQHLAKIDPGKADTFTANAEILRRDLTALDQDYTKGLASCANKDLVTSHNAFGYLAQRYGLTQVGITGLDPEKEPSAGDLAAVAAFVRAHHVRTIYYETLVSPAIARTVASETSAATAVLDPIEGLTNQSAGSNYLQLMRANLAALRAGQPCT
jgi:zinc transport system substrate-binding protein